MSDKVEIGKTIVKLRKSRRITQERLAEAANVSVSYLRDIEHDCANPTISILEDIADALQISLPALIISSTADEE
ncbi:MAG: helix-turn-helix domain-containing protein [Oscillospiraceae bacterium]|nr:helix-turn-helix domain-containing protein [Oscillospiraceae bacterium]